MLNWLAFFLNDTKRVSGSWCILWMKRSCRDSNGLEVENTHIYKLSFMCGGAIPIKDKKAKHFFPRVPTEQNKRESAGKGVIEEVAGLKWFKPCDIWFHGDSFYEWQRAEHEKSDSLPRMQHWRPGQLPYRHFQASVWAEGSAGPAGGLPQLCEVHLQFIKTFSWNGWG